MTDIGAVTEIIAELREIRRLRPAHVADMEVKTAGLLGILRDTLEDAIAWGELPSREALAEVSAWSDLRIMWDEGRADHCARQRFCISFLAGRPGNSQSSACADWHILANRAWLAVSAAGENVDRLTVGDLYDALFATETAARPELLRLNLGRWGVDEDDAPIRLS